MTGFRLLEINLFSSLDRNEYNHITATYFLLAERKLRSHKLASLQKTNSASGMTNAERAERIRVFYSFIFNHLSGSKAVFDDSLTRKRSGSNPSSPVKEQPSDSTASIL